MLRKCSTRQLAERNDALLGEGNGEDPAEGWGRFFCAVNQPRAAVPAEQGKLSLSLQTMESSALRKGHCWDCGTGLCHQDLALQRQSPGKQGKGKGVSSSHTQEPGRREILHLVTPAAKRKVLMQNYTKHLEEAGEEPAKVRTGHLWKAGGQLLLMGLLPAQPRHPEPLPQLSRAVLCLKTAWSQAIDCINPKTAPLCTHE